MKKYFEIELKGKWKLAELIAENENDKTFFLPREETEITLNKEGLIREINIDPRYLKNLGFKYSKRSDSYLIKHLYLKRFEIIENNSIEFIGYFICQVAHSYEYQILKNNEKEIKNNVQDLDFLADNFNLIKTINQLFVVLDTIDSTIIFNEENVMKKSYYEI